MYKTETTLGPGGAPVYRKAPRFSFGPTGMRRRGMQQSRNEVLKVSRILTGFFFPLDKLLCCVLEQMQCHMMHVHARWVKAV